MLLLASSVFVYFGGTLGFPLAGGFPVVSAAPDVARAVGLLA